MDFFVIAIRVVILIFKDVWAWTSEQDSDRIWPLHFFFIYSFFSLFSFKKKSHNL